MDRQKQVTACTRDLRKVPTPAPEIDPMLESLQRIKVRLATVDLPLDPSKVLLHKSLLPRQEARRELADSRHGCHYTLWWKLTHQARDSSPRKSVS